MPLHLSGRRGIKGPAHSLPQLYTGIRVVNLGWRGRFGERLRTKKKGQPEENRLAQPEKSRIGKFSRFAPLSARAISGWAQQFNLDA